MRGGCDCVGERFQLDHRGVAAIFEQALIIQHVGNAAGHARAEVAAGRAQHGNSTASHVLATVIPRSFDDCRCTRIANTKALTSDATEICFARDGTVHHGVADDDIFQRITFEVGVRLDNHPPTAQALAHVIVGLPGQLHRHTTRQKSGKTLARRSAELDVDGVLRQARMAVSLGDFTGQHGTGRTI